MAEEDSSQEKTEEATPRRLEKAREEGDVPRSRELSTFTVLMAGAVGLWVFGDRIVNSVIGMMKDNLSIERAAIYDTKQMAIHLASAANEVVLALVPLMGVLTVAAIIGPLGLGGWNFASKAIMPKGSRINPISGLKRMFSMRSLVELVKGLLKVTLVGGLAVLIMDWYQTEILFLPMESMESALAHSANIILWSAIALSASTLIIAAIDVPYQIYEHAKKLKMSMQDIKDEFKETEGKPEVKRKVRQLQMEMAQRRMMGDVPDADVIITNPTHYSVALKYDPSISSAPIMLAKGADQIALKIREIGNEYDIPILEAPPLARSIYYNTEIGDEIPEGLYVAIAQVLAYIFQMDQYMAGRGPKPKDPKDFPIPDDLQHE
ncbi:flagellar biosynthesis protein FlhB [Litoribrevibacter euphylliae]|uniref:Flagellar biosynthetic protein FlhB n=1 Tax=Litoribrevibacter euphylliae TaxID=1834034 RepID=A0ABV7HDU6_9GAMM